MVDTILDYLIKKRNLDSNQYFKILYKIKIDEIRLIFNLKVGMFLLINWTMNVSILQSFNNIIYLTRSTIKFDKNDPI